MGNVGEFAVVSTYGEAREAGCVRHTCLIPPVSVPQPLWHKHLTITHDQRRRRVIGHLELNVKLSQADHTTDVSDGSLAEFYSLASLPL